MLRRNPLADQVWRAMSALVIDNRETWRRTAAHRTGLPFSRIRILRRLARRPMTVKQIAEAATIDAPAATVAVNDLEERHLVARRTNPDNRRCKIVSLTDAGRNVVGALEAIDDPAPAALAALSDDDLTVLLDVMNRLVDQQTGWLLAEAASGQS